MTPGEYVLTVALLIAVFVVVPAAYYSGGFRAVWGCLLDLAGFISDVAVAAWRFWRDLVRGRL